MTFDQTRSAETDAVFVAFSAKERRATKTGNHGVLVVIMQMHCYANWRRPCVKRMQHQTDELYTPSCCRLVSTGADVTKAQIFVQFRTKAQSCPKRGILSGVLRGVQPYNATSPLLSPSASVPLLPTPPF